MSNEMLFSGQGEARSAITPVARAWAGSRLMILAVLLACFWILADLGRDVFTGASRSVPSGFLVPVVILLVLVSLPTLFRTLWFHTVLGLPILFVKSGVLSYMLEGRNSVALSQIASIRFGRKAGVRQLLVSITGREEPQRYSLLLCREDS